MGKYLRLMRVKHYIKNLLVFLPLIVSGKAINIEMISKVLMGFISFSLAASIIYIINDIYDVDYDRKNYKKKDRPIASGEISKKRAVEILFVLFIMVMLLNIGRGNNLLSWIILFTYVIINIAYSIWLKNIPILDVSIIVAGFVLRVTYGGAVIGVSISNLMYLTIMMLSFYLAFGKRRNEILMYDNHARIVLKYYTKEFLDKMMYISLGLAITFYSLWCITPNEITNESRKLLWTIPIVLIILIRYCMNVEEENDGDPAEILLGDRPLLLLVSFYGVLLMGLIYSEPILKALW